MVNVDNKRCLHDYCTKVPSYNLEGVKPAVYCKQHSEDGMVGVCGRRCLHGSCTKKPSYRFEGSYRFERPVAFCKLHAEDGPVNVRTPCCVHDSCTTRLTCISQGRKEVYCKLLAGDGVINVCTRRSPNDSSTVGGASRRVPTDGVPAVRVRLKRENLGSQVTSVSVEALCEAAGCLKRPRWRSDGEYRTQCLDHALLEDGFVAGTAPVVIARGLRCSRTSSFLRSNTHLDINGDDGRTPAKRIRHRLYRRASPP